MIRTRDTMPTTHLQGKTIHSGSTVPLHEGQGGKPTITLTPFSYELTELSATEKRGTGSVFDSVRPSETTAALEKLRDELDKHFVLG